MDEQNLNLATQGEDGGQGDGSQNGGAGAANANEPFLPVNDRTVYKTREDAIRGFSEAQTTITSLSEYRKLAEQFLGKDAATPENVRWAFEQAVKHQKAEKERADAEAAKSAAGGDNDPRFVGQTAEQIKLIKETDKWFKDNAERYGYVSKDMLKKYDERIAAIEQGGTAKTEESFQEAGRAGTVELQAQLKASNVTLDDTEFGKLTKRIKSYIDGDDDLVRDWQKAVSRGDVAKTNAIIMEAAKFSIGAVKAGAKFVDAVTAKVQAGQSKNALLNAAPKRLPQPGTGAEQKPGELKRVARPLGRKENTARALAIMEEAELAAGG